MQTRAHVAVLNAAGKATAAKHGLHVVDFELMASRFEKPANYLAVRCLRPSVKINQKMHYTNLKSISNEINARPTRSKLYETAPFT